MDVGLAWRRNAHFTPVMEAFRSYFRQTFFIPTVRQRHEHRAVDTGHAIFPGGGFAQLPDVRMSAYEPEDEDDP
jgi:hypothetical protein